MEFNTTEIGCDEIRLRTIDVDRLNMFFGHAHVGVLDFPSSHSIQSGICIRLELENPMFV